MIFALLFLRFKKAISYYLIAKPEMFIVKAEI